MRVYAKRRSSPDSMMHSCTRVCVRRFVSGYSTNRPREPLIRSDSWFPRPIGELATDKKQPGAGDDPCNRFYLRIFIFYSCICMNARVRRFQMASVDETESVYACCTAGGCWDLRCKGVCALLVPLAENNASHKQLMGPRHSAQANKNQVHENTATKRLARRGEMRGKKKLAVRACQLRLRLRPSLKKTAKPKQKQARNHRSDHAPCLTARPEHSP